MNNNFTNLDVCKTPLIAKQEYCFHEPPLEMALKIAGMYLCLASQNIFFLPKITINFIFK